MRCRSSSFSEAMQLAMFLLCVPGCFREPPEVKLQTKETKWPNGRRFESVTFYTTPQDEEVLHGPQITWGEITWGESGKKFLDCTYRHGKLNGTLTEWHEGGNKAREGQYVEDLQEGTWTGWWSDGRKRWEAHYVHGLPSEATTYYDSTGLKIEEAALKLQTKEIKWPNGRPLKTVTFYKTAQGEEVLHGPQITWFESGKKFVECMYKHGKLNGTRTQWDEGGDKDREGQFVENLEEGTWTAWWFDAKKRWEEHYVHGLPRGTATWYDLSGIKTGEEVYDGRGRMTETTTWFTADQKSMHGAFTNGKKGGRWTYWDRNGRVRAEGDWRDGKPWSGICGTPALGDAGSWGGIEVFGEYRAGKLIREVRLPDPLPDAKPGSVPGAKAP